jgi:hypothetical protein
VRKKSERYGPRASDVICSAVAPQISPLQSSHATTEAVAADFLLAHSIIISPTMKLSLALATLAVGGASAFSVNNQYGALRTSTQLNAVRQPIMAGNWKVNRY